MTRRKRTGRRPGTTDTASTILAAARQEFADKGYDKATMRSIAAAAQVDPALVHHYYGSKEDLFLSAVAQSEDVRSVLAAVAEPSTLSQPPGLSPTDQSRGLVRRVLTLWSSPAGAAGLALLRSAVNSEMAARLLREMLTSTVIRHATTGFSIPEHERATRYALLASQMAGLALTRHVLKIEPLASASIDQVVDAVAPTVERYLFGDIDGLLSESGNKA